MKIVRTWKSLAILYSLLVIVFLPYSSNAAPTFINATSPDLPIVARGIPMGGAINVFGLDLDEIGRASLELERFNVFEPGAQLIVDNIYTVAPPTDTYFRGHVAELPNSIVVLAIPEKGAIRGIITDTNGVWLLAGNSGYSAPKLISRKINLETELKGKPFECGTEQILHDAVDLLPTSGEGSNETASLPANVTHTARVAIETDYEYYAMFGNVNAANTYMADLFAYASTVYEREVNTNLVISWSRLWTESEGSDPWNGPYTNSTESALYEFQDYWNSGSDVNIPTTRTIAHMLSGKSLGGGIAYISVLCYSHYGNSTNYDFGLSASLSGNFNISNPSVVWDILVVTHEIGHNFSSYHSHDYCGIGGNSEPVDLCWDSADCGSKIGLPGIDTLAGGTTVEKPGTIMSYCHLLSGGYSNISFTFGKDHYYGIDAFRIPNVMKNHVAERASSFPACLALDNSNPILTVNKAGGGNGLVTSNPEGINCDPTCSAGFPESEAVTLTATADPGSEFSGWGGDCTVDGQVTIDADKTCTAIFTSLCGNGNLDEGEDCDGDSFAVVVDCGGCMGTPSCNTECSIDMSPCYNNLCETGENCDSCPQDCIEGTSSGAVCGNNICEAGNGEDCVSCPADCNGIQVGKPSGRFCCGDGDGNSPVNCSDGRCGGPEACTDITVPAVDYCCGDGSCSDPEDGYSCELDCGPPPFCGDFICNGEETICSCSNDCGMPPSNETMCADNIDNDCDGNIDAADTDCPNINCSGLDQETCVSNPTCRWHRKKGCVNR